MQALEIDHLVRRFVGSTNIIERLPTIFTNFRLNSNWSLFDYILNTVQSIYLQGRPKHTHFAVDVLKTEQIHRDFFSFLPNLLPNDAAVWWILCCCCAFFFFCFVIICLLFSSYNKAAFHLSRLMFCAPRLPLSNQSWRRRSSGRHHSPHPPKTVRTRPSTGWLYDEWHRSIESEEITTFY